MRCSADGLKALSMELGGKSPVIVFADADLDAALDSVVFGVFSSTASAARPGRACSWNVPSTRIHPALGGTRREGAGRAAVRPRHRGRRTRPPRALRPRPGVRRDRPAGGQAGRGGGRPGHLPEGNYLQPAVFTDVPGTRGSSRRRSSARSSPPPLRRRGRGGRAGQRHPLRPRRLRGTNDLRRGHRIAQNVASGMVWINSHNVRDLRTPFGGVKDSGLGREGGAHSIDFFSESKIVHVMLGDGTPPFRRPGAPASTPPTSSAPPTRNSPSPTWPPPAGSGSTCSGCTSSTRTPTPSTCAAPTS